MIYTQVITQAKISQALRLHVNFLRETLGKIAPLRWGAFVEHRKALLHNTFEETLWRETVAATLLWDAPAGFSPMRRKGFLFSKPEF
jgi:hypothetical protein